MKRLALLFSMLGLVCCSTGTNDELAGGPGSETTNGIVAMVNGSPASYAGVALRKVNFKVDELVPENAIVQPDNYANEDGNFTLEYDSAGTFRLTVVHGGSAFTKVVSGSEMANMDTVVLEPTGSVAGSVNVPKGSGFVWVGVHGMDVMVKSDSAGQFSLPQLPSTDSLDIYFVRNDKESVFNSVGVKPEAYQTTIVEVEGDIPEGMSQFVALVDGKPAMYAMMSMRPVDFRVEKASIENAAIVADYFADVSGKVLFDLPDSGDVRLTVVQSGYAFSKILSAEEVAELDTVELTAMSNIQSKVTLSTNAKHAWVGVTGLDVLVKTDKSGKFSLPLLPAGDTLELYMATASFDSVYVTEKILLDPGVTEFYSPVKVLSDFEEDSLTGAWYFSADKIGSSITYGGKTVSGKSNDAAYPSLSVTVPNAKDSVRGGVFYGKYSMFPDDNAWVLVGTLFGDSSWNFSELDSISFRIKGKGQVRVTLERWDTISEMFGSAEKAASGWMDMSASKWTKFVIKPTDLCYTAQDVPNCASSWESIKGHVQQMHVFVRGGSEFYLDDIRLYGALF